VWACMQNGGREIPLEREEGSEGFALRSLIYQSALRRCLVIVEGTQRWRLA